MTTLPTAQPLPTSTIPRAETTFYFAIALPLCGLSLLLPCLARFGILSGPPEQYMMFAPIAVFSPMIAGLLASRRESGREGMRTLMRGLKNWKVHPIWFLLALVLPGLIYTAARGVYALIPGNQGDAPWLGLPINAQQVVGMILVPIGEEIGWRGYALPRLQKRHGSFQASMILGVLWGLWHIPMFIASGMQWTPALLMLVSFLPGNLFFTWFYNRTNRSTLLAVLLHVGVHLDTPTHVIPETTTSILIYTLGYCGVVALLFLLDRRAFVDAEQA